MLHTAIWCDKNLCFCILTEYHIMKYPLSVWFCPFVSRIVQKYRFWLNQRAQVAIRWPHAPPNWDGLPSSQAPGRPVLGELWRLKTHQLMPKKKLPARRRLFWHQKNWTPRGACLGMTWDRAAWENLEISHGQNRREFGPTWPLWLLLTVVTKL